MQKYLYGVLSFVLAFAILSVTVLKVVPQAYGYSAPIPSNPQLYPSPVPKIDYALPFAGRVLPDNWLWYLKAFRDKIQYTFTFDPLKKAELALLYSDKRLTLSSMLFKNKKPDIALSTLVKGEKYLEESSRDEALARSVGMNTNEFLKKLALSSLKHSQIINEEIIPYSPEDLKPGVIVAENYSKNVYKASRDALYGKGITPPNNPFNWQ